MKTKRVLCPERLRHVPHRFSWIDQRLVRDGHIARCGPQALALYLLLVTVADAQGLSYYSDKTAARLLSLNEAQYSVLFANAIDVINTLSAAQTKGALKSELKRYLSPALLLLDEIGYLPIDQRGADLLFQVISQRYERGSIVLTSNKAFKQWATIFNGDSTITSAVLDRLLHHAETVLIEGSSYRMKDRIES